MYVNGTRDVSVKTGVEQSIRILQGSAFSERHLDVVLVSFSSADDAIMGPDGDSCRITRFPPLHLFDNFRVRLLDELAHPPQSFPAPIIQYTNVLTDQLGGSFLASRSQTIYQLPARQKLSTRL